MGKIVRSAVFAIPQFNREEAALNTTTDDILTSKERGESKQLHRAWLKPATLESNITVHGRRDSRSMDEDVDS